MTSESLSTTWRNLFSNSFATVGEFQRLLQSFVPIRFSQHDRTVTQIPNTSSSARSSSPPSPIGAFLTRQQTPPLFAVFLALTRSPNLRTKTICRELIPEAFQRNFAITIGRKGNNFQKLFSSKNLCGRWRGARTRAG